MSEAVVDAIQAMQAADPEPERTHTVGIYVPGGFQTVTLPDSWKAKRAAMSVLGVTVTVNTEASGQPRWVAEMRLPGGTVVTGVPEADQYRVKRGYTFASNR